MYEIMTIGRADDQFFEGELKKWTHCYSNVVVIEGNLDIDGDFDGRSLALPEGADLDDEMLIAVTGDLKVSGRIRFYEHTPGLFVKGNVVAETMECGDSELICQGHATVSYFVLGSYNDGRMDVGADVPFVISNRGHGVGVAARHALYIEGAGGCIDYDYQQEEIPIAFVSDVLQGVGIDAEAFYIHLKAGLSVFAHGGTIAQEKIRLTLGSSCPECGSTDLSYVSRAQSETSEELAACDGCGGMLAIHLKSACHSK